MDLLHWCFTGLLLLLLGAAPGCTVDARPCASTRDGHAPSFIVIVADTLRADFVSRGSGGASLTPALDAFANEAVSFRAAFSQAPRTTPSVASLLTGLHPQAHGLVQGTSHHAGVLAAENDTLPEALSEAGYETAAFVANQWLLPGYGFEQGFDHYEFVRRGRVGNVFARAIGWLAERSSDRPYFLYLHLMEVHGPYTAPDRFVREARAALAGQEERPLSADEFEAIPEYMRAYSWTRGARARDLREWRTRYAAGVAAFDAAFGRFSDVAGKNGWLDQAVLVVTSDHGEELLDHGAWGHGSTFYDEQLHVPLLVRLPEARNGGRTVDALSSLIDLRPTLLSLAGQEDVLEVASTHRGRDRSPLLCGTEAAPQRGSETTIATASKHDPDLYSLRTPEYKLVFDARSEESALFHLARDPAEQRDVSDLEPEQARRLERALREHVSAMEARRGRAETAPVDPEVRAQLEALGYVDAEPDA